MGRQNVDVLLLHIGDILGNFLYLIDTVVQNARKEFLGIEIFEIGGAVGDDGVSGGVGFIEGVRGEAFHVREYLCGDVGGNPLRRSNPVMLPPCAMSPKINLSFCAISSSLCFFAMARRTRSACPSE